MSFFLLALLLPQPAKLIAARSSSDFACCLRAISMALRKHASASAWGLGVRDWGLVTDLTFDLCLTLTCTVEASARLSADTALPRSNAPQFCPPQPAPRPARSALPLTCPTFPYASASRARKYGRASSAPVARQAARPWRIWAIPSSPCPCSASAQPRRIVPSANQNGNPCSVESVNQLPLPALGLPAPPGGADGARQQSPGHKPG